MDDYGPDFLKPEGGQRLKVGDSFEINERRAAIMGVVPARRAFSGAPLLVRTSAGEDAAAVAKQI